MQRQAGDSRPRDDAERRRKAERLSLVVHVAETGAAAGADRHPVEVDGDVSHRAEVEHDGSLGDRGSGDVVPAAPNGDRQSVLARVRDGGDHVRIAGATHDQRRTAVDHAVPDPTCSVVAAVTFGDHLSSHPLPQLVQLNGLGYRHARLLLAVDVVRYVSPRPGPLQGADRSTD